mmetsp:Transcript_112627/g.290911  ORF Transcript_112627/g.290911 Transcript_112627/m.290911 type:complete len:527 (-) Transcript_112627:336-1916(-)
MATSGTRGIADADLVEYLLVAAVNDPDPPRERADVADLIRHVQQLKSPQLGGPPSPPPVQRSSSWCDAVHRRMSTEVGDYRRQLCTPGGFRRDHLHSKADAQGLSTEQRPESWSVSLLDSMRGSVQLYEHSFGLPYEANTQTLVGGLSNLGVAVAVFKGNIGSNILFMPHAFQQGGFMIGALLLPLLAALSILCVVRLIRCRAGNTQSYGDLMEKATNRYGRGAVSVCVVLLQVGTCCSYLINVAEMLHKTFFPSIETWVLICCEATVISPLVLIRNVAKLSPVNLVGGALTILGICVTFGLLGSQLSSDGAVSVEPVNSRGLMVCIGIACFAFEGIGLVIPIYDSCRFPGSFAVVYSATIATIVLLIVGMSFLGYLAFGCETNTLVLVNLPEGLLTKGVQLTFSLVMLFSFPLQLLPAIRIVEGLFLQPSRPMTWDKHVKSSFRVVFVALVAVTSVCGATSLDHFVSLIGAVCGLPLAFIFPAICHKSLVAAPRSLDAIVDVALVALGMVMTVCVGTHTVMTWGS